MIAAIGNLIAVSGPDDTLLFASPGPRHDVHAPRIRTFAYDVGSTRRAYRVRRALRGWQVAGQYSVVDTYLGTRDRDGLLTELVGLLDAGIDSLALWQPYEQRRYELQRPNADNECSSDPALRVHDFPPVGNWVFAYDVRAASRLRAVHRIVSASTFALQRSVYWLRSSRGEAALLASQLLQIVDRKEDSLWIYPLRHPGDLWIVVGREPPVLPAGGIEGQYLPGTSPARAIVGARKS